MATSSTPRSSEPLTPSAFSNATLTMQSIGSSTYGITPFTATANRSPHGYNLNLLDEIGRIVPMVIDLKPSRRPRQQRASQTRDTEPT